MTPSLTSYQSSVTDDRSRVRRSHPLGACKTCQRRHTKCDRSRPDCYKCHRLGIVCGGYSDQVRWMPTVRSDGYQEPVGEKVDDEDRRGTRYQLYTEQARLSMSTSLSAGLVSGSIDASLDEIEVRLSSGEFRSCEDIRVGPFAVLSLSNESLHGIDPIQHESVRLEDASHNHAPPAHPVRETDQILSLIDPLVSVDELIHWPDPFDLSYDISGIIPGQCLDTPASYWFGPDLAAADGEVYLPPLNEGEGEGYYISGTREEESHNAKFVMTPSQTTDTSFVDVLADAAVLLRNFQDNVIPHLAVISLGYKSPWRELHLRSAMITLGDIKFLGLQDISHARMANLFGLLSCSAIHLASDSSRRPVGSTQHWTRIASFSYCQAKDHIGKSLQEETPESQTAEYKDQLMAVCGITAFSIFHGRYQDARCSIMNAERLLRLRGLQKFKTSRKARLLLNLYTWLRIMGESTYLLHDYTPSESFIEALNHYSYHCQTSTANTSPTPANERKLPLDDFRHLTPQRSDNDLNIDQPKDSANDIPDFHLQDSRKSSESLYRQVYGIPETWLSLVSQTTRLANVMDTCHIAHKKGQSVDQNAREAILQRSICLENVICSSSLNNIQESVLDQLEGPKTPVLEMLSAFTSALVIFFYRRIRLVHPAVLQGHVDKVIAAMQEFDNAVTEGDPTGPGTIWPVFMAGCEALTPAKRTRILKILENGEKRCGLVAPFQKARAVMTQLWEKQDNHQATKCLGSFPTWVDLVKEEQIWPVFC